jgi:hypothetical protein
VTKRTEKLKIKVSGKVRKGGKTKELYNERKKEENKRTAGGD